MSEKYRDTNDDSDRAAYFGKIEDLIHTAFGPHKKNIVNFKLLQTILHIFAHQMNLLEQDVNFTCEEYKYSDTTTKRGGYYDEDDEESGISSGSSADREQGEAGAERRRDRDKKRKSKDQAGIEKQDDKKDRGKTRGETERDKEDEKKNSKDSPKKAGKDVGRPSLKDRKSKDWEGKDREDKDREGKDREGRDREGKDREGKDWKGKNWEGKDREGKDREDKSREGKDREGKDRGGKDREDKDREGKDRSKDRDDRKSRDKRSKDRDISSKSRRGEDDDEEGVRSRRQSRDRGRELGDDVRGRRSRQREDRDAQEQRDGGFGRDFSRRTSGTSTVSGVRQRANTIQVVTASQFALLAEAVKQLEQVTGPVPLPEMPDNEKLRKDLASGRASLQDTMQAVQLNERVKAAEQGMYRMADLISELAQSGILPPEIAARVGALEEYLQAAVYAAAGANRSGGPGGTGGRRVTSGPGSTGGPGGTSGPYGTGGPGGTFGPGGIGGPGGPGGTGGRRTTSGPGGAGGQGGAGGPRGTGGTGGTGGSGGTGGADGTGGAGGNKEGPSRSTLGAKSTIAETSDATVQSRPVVTHNELHEMLQHMRNALAKEINNLTSRSNRSADVASATSRGVAEKLDIAMQINDRVTTLFDQTADYAEQLSGFDTGITRQVQSFQEQLATMRSDLSGGLALLEASNNNAETAVLVDLTERYQGLVVDLNSTVHLHQNLHVTQYQIADELKNMIQCVEMLREQKADRDEVLDGLRDKADLSRLAGLLYAKDFAHARFEIEKRIATCHDKFNKQEKKWQTALRDLMAISQNKAEVMMLMALKDATNADIQAIQLKLHDLEVMLGEPKAALLLRNVARDSSGSASEPPALVQPQDAAPGKLLAPPAPRPRPLGPDEPCLGKVYLALPEIREHTCHRWVGGSHTVIADNVVKEQAEPMLHIRSTKKFEGYGIDGKLYLMEEDIQPCAECYNRLCTDEPGATHTGAGDQASANVPCEKIGDA